MKKKKYIVNENYFDVLNEESAYWLGFLYADGNVSSDRNRVSITLSEKDKDHLLKYQNCLQSNHPIYLSKGRYSKDHTYTNKVKSAITSKRLKTRLIELGCIPQKTLKLEFPELPEELIPHFIRGYFDGDGTVYLCKHKNPNWNNSIRIEIVGNFKFLEVLKVKLGYPNKILKVEKRSKNDICYFRVGGTNIVKNFHDYIYSDSSVFLIRKKEIFDEYFKQKGSTTIMDTSNKMDEGIV